ncbi:hypothetical protein O8B39_22545 [Agrobacterium rhizogenes]|nr:hypothetical protein [Rhizobium rhizogenes]
MTTSPREKTIPFYIMTARQSALSPSLDRKTQQKVAAAVSKRNCPRRSKVFDMDRHHGACPHGDVRNEIELFQNLTINRLVLSGSLTLHLLETCQSLK